MHHLLTLTLFPLPPFLQPALKASGGRSNKKGPPEWAKVATFTYPNTARASPPTRAQAYELRMVCDARAQATHMHVHAHTCSTSLCAWHSLGSESIVASLQPGKGGTCTYTECL